MARKTWTDFSRGLWLVGPRENNPDGTLRRAKGIYPLRGGALRSRSGTAQFASLSAHSMTRFNDRYVIGAGTDLYVTDASRTPNSETLIANTSVFDGTRLAFVQMPPTAGKADQLFIAGGGDLKKLANNFSTFTEWGISPPDISSMTATADAQLVKVIDNLDDITNGDADNSIWVDAADDEADAAVFQNAGTHFIEGTGSMRLTLAKNNDMAVQRTGLTMDLTDIGSGAGTSPIDDYITFAVRINRPKHVKSIEIAFDVEGAATAFKGKLFKRELTIKEVRRKRKKRLFGTGDIIRPRDEKTFLADNKNADRDFSQKEFLDTNTIAVVKRAWTRVTISKASFDASGGAVDADWATVKAIRLSASTNRLGKARVHFDDLKMIGGVGMQGDYRYNITYLNSSTGTRSNPDLTNTVVVRDIQRQGVSLANIPEPPSGSQADKIEIWRTLGNGQNLFLAKTIVATPGGGTTSTTDKTADYPGMFDTTTGSSAPADARAFLDSTTELPLDNIKPDATFEDAVGPHLGRVWWCRNTTAGAGGRVYFSPAGRSEAVEGFIEVAGDDDQTQKLAILGSRLYVFTQRKLYQVIGTAQPFVAVEVFGAPGTTQPHSVAVTPSGIAYFASDGPRLFDGSFSRPIGKDEPLAPVFRGSAVENVQAFQGTVAAYGRGEYYVSDPRVATPSTAKTTLAITLDGAYRDLGFASNFLFYDIEANLLFGANVPTSGTYVWHTTQKGGGSLSVTTAAPYLPIAVDGSVMAATGTLGKTQLKMPQAVTVTGMYVTLGTALAGTETLDCNLNINGTKNTSMTVSLTSAATTASATGSVALAEDDLVALEFTLGGGLATGVVQFVTVAYELTFV